jgi:hypothetical protein
MSNSWKKRIAYLAVGTVTVAGMTGAFGTAAFADDDRTAPAVGNFDAYAQSVLSASGDIAAVAPGADGGVTVYYDSEKATVDELKAEVPALQSVTDFQALPGGLTKYADTDIVGGAGYITAPSLDATSVGLCSVGFSGWSAEGDPAVISAGHCTADGANLVSALSLPTGDPAGGAPEDNSEIQATYPIGELAFSQYGGPGNSAGSESTNSVDISVYDVLNADLTTLPEVTDWTTAASEDLSASTKLVRAVGTAAIGPVSKSGRTTGFTNGNVIETGTWGNVSDRLVYGFLANLTSAEGDSGGALIQGETAVGVLSGGGTLNGAPVTFGADLQAGLALAGGYTVALFVDAPAVTSVATGGEVLTGTTISGTGPAGANLEVVLEGGETTSVPIDAAGNWAFPAPNEFGAANYTLTAVRGFDRSASVDLDVTVVLGAPAITSPANGQSVETDVPTISGTGFPGATVTLTGDVEGTALVAESGLWSIEAGGLAYGAYSVSATQAVADTVSDAAVSSFKVVAAAPIITSPVNGTTYEPGSAPTQLTGTGIAGATLVALVNGNPAGSVTVAENGTWAIPFASALAAGTYEFSAAQVINDVSGTVAKSTITVAAAAEVPSAPTGNGPGLANTGSPVAPLVGGGALALLLAAGGVLLMVRRNQTTAADRRS